MTDDDAKPTMPASLLWLDMEMTGLDAQTDRILEVAVLLTDDELQEIAIGPELVLHQSEATLAAMDDWNQRHHGASGLIERVRCSSVDEAAAEDQLLAFLQAHCPAHTALLAGNSVHQDWAFLCRYLPAVEAYLHYRHLDVSTVKELVRRWQPTIFAAAPAKQKRHRALDDLRESIAELRYYRQQAFRPYKVA